MANNNIFEKSAVCLQFEVYQLNMKDTCLTLACLTHIIVDDVDDNDRFCDLLLLILSDALTRYKMLKLILLSNSDSPNAFK